MGLANSTSKSFTVGIIVDGSYTPNRAADDPPITVSRPTTTNAVSSNGSLVNGYSGGLYAGDAGLHADLLFQASLNSSAGNLQGTARITIRHASFTDLSVRATYWLNDAPLLCC